MIINLAEGSKRKFESIINQILGEAARPNLTGFWAIAIEMGKVVGVSGSHLVPICDQFILYLGPTAVIPSAQGRGLQRSFIKNREDLAVRLGIFVCITKIDFDNYKSLNNFIRCNYLTFLPPPDMFEQE